MGPDTNITSVILHRITDHSAALANTQIAFGMRLQFQIGEAGAYASQTRARTNCGLLAVNQWVERRRPGLSAF